MECIMSGWLTKSPPEKKTQGPWKLFKAKWRKRYFVLNEVPAAQSLPGHRAALLYFDSENMKHKLGQIDLSSCDEVQQRLESSFYRHVFSLRTKHKGKDRTYYLVAESESDMNKWVDCLCCVLGLKESDCERKNSVSSTLWKQSSSNVGQGAQAQNSALLEPEVPLSATQPSPRMLHSAFENNNDNGKGEQYIHLDECWTGNKKEDLDLIPPPPPAHDGRKYGSSLDPRWTKMGSSGFSHVDRVTTDSTYDMPRSYQPSGTPTNFSRSFNFQNDGRNDEYDIPRSTLERHSREVVTTDDTYDIPRSAAQQSPTSVTRHGTGTMERWGNDHGDRYINLPETNKGHPIVNDSTYDFPMKSEARTTSREMDDTALLDCTPPPPASHMPKINRYVNAKAGVVPPPTAFNQNDTTALSDLTLERMDRVPSTLPKSSASGDSQVGAAAKDSRSQLLFSNNRTRSFKRHITSPDSTKILLPTKKDGIVSDESSSDDDEDHEPSSRGLEPRGAYQPKVPVALPPKKSLNSTPPPPPAAPLEVQYLDLDLGAEKPGAKNDHIIIGSMNKDTPPPPASTTDYREIDFVKTKALGRMKQDVEKKRLSSEQSTDES